MPRVMSCRMEHLSPRGTYDWGAVLDFSLSGCRLINIFFITRYKLDLSGSLYQTIPKNWTMFRWRSLFSIVHSETNLRMLVSAVSFNNQKVVDFLGRAKGPGNRYFYYAAIRTRADFLSSESSVVNHQLFQLRVVL